MFAPHCPTCHRRVLLGARRIVRLAWDGDGDLVVVLRCFCGKLVDWDQRPPMGQGLGPGRATPGDRDGRGA